MTYVAGMSFSVPGGTRVAYPQGIDSTLLHISGPGFEISADDYGSYGGGGDRMLGGRLAKLEERRQRECRERTWEVELPATDPTSISCPSASERPGQCVAAAAHANLRTLCSTDAACKAVDAIIASARFAPRPWPALVTPDGDWKPPEPVCSVTYR